MIPELMNCAHSGEGWCLDCVGAIHQKLTLERDHSNWLQSECDKAVDDLYHRNGVHRKFRAEADAALEELEINLNTKAWATVADGKFSKIGHGISETPLLKGCAI